MLSGIMCLRVFDLNNHYGLTKAWGLAALHFALVGVTQGNLNKSIYLVKNSANSFQKLG